MARAAVNMTVAELAAAASVAPNTVNRFETGKAIPHVNNLAAIQRALEAAGVEFIEHGVRLKAPPSSARET